MRVYKSAPLVACVLALVAGCGLDMGGLSADVLPDDAGVATTSDDAAASPEAAPPTGQSDGGDAIATTLDASSGPDAKGPAEAGPTGPPPPPKGPPGQGDDGGDPGPGKGPAKDH